MASWLLRSSPARGALAGDIVLCSWARHFTLTVPREAANLMLGVTLQWTNIPGGEEILLVALCYGNRDKLRPGRPLGILRTRFLKNYCAEWQMFTIELNL